MQSIIKGRVSAFIASAGVVVLTLGFVFIV